MSVRGSSFVEVALPVPLRRLFTYRIEGVRAAAGYPGPGPVSQPHPDGVGDGPRDRGAARSRCGSRAGPRACGGRGAARPGPLDRPVLRGAAGDRPTHDASDSAEDRPAQTPGGADRARGRHAGAARRDLRPGRPPARGLRAPAGSRRNASPHRNGGKRLQPRGSEGAGEQGAGRNPGGGRPEGSLQRRGWGGGGRADADAGAAWGPEGADERAGPGEGGRSCCTA